MELAIANIYRPKWSQQVHDEWIAAVLRTRPDVDPNALQRRCAMMDSTFPDAMIANVAQMAWPDLPDPADAHVNAAAICARADVIVTNNIRHFPSALMADFGMVVQSADAFLHNALDISEHKSRKAIQILLQRRKRPEPWNTGILALELESRSLLLTASSVRNLFPNMKTRMEVEHE